MADYPETEGFAYGFQRGELTLNGNVYTAISNIEIDQPTESEAVMGTSPTPLSETEGQMDMGEGTVTFSDDRERFRFIDDLGEAYRNKRWGASWVIRNAQGNEVQIKCIGCRVVSNPISHSSGTTALGGDIGFKFFEHTINGKRPHGSPSAQ